MTSNPEKLPLETKQVDLDNMVMLTLKLCHKTSLVSYSTENGSNTDTIVCGTEKTQFGVTITLFILFFICIIGNPPVGSRVE